MAVSVYEKSLTENLFDAFNCKLKAKERGTSDGTTKQAGLIPINFNN
jgi:hypothetical protein